VAYELVSRPKAGKRICKQRLALSGHARTKGARVTDLRKMMIVNLLGRKFGFRSYMELATPSTGRFYAEVDRDYFENVARMMYVTPFVFDDGMEVDFRSPDEDISAVLEDFRQSGRTMDISLVDGWHTYQTAQRDLVQFFDLLSDGGILVVHDCLPESREGATPRFKTGSWWGMSYKAFLDFVLQTPSLDYFTLDCDHGCGVIVKNRVFETLLGPDAPSGWLPPRPDADRVARWLAVGADFDLAYTLFEAEHRALLRLVPADRFMALFSDDALERARKPALLPAKPPDPHPEKPPEKPSAQPRASIDTRLMRFLQRKLAAVTGENIGAAAAKGKSTGGDRDQT